MKRSYLCRKLNVWQLVFPLVFLKHSSAHPRTVVADIEFRYVKCLYPVRIRSKHSIKIEILLIIAYINELTDMIFSALKILQEGGIHVSTKKCFCSKYAMILQNKTFFTSILDIKYSMYSIVISYPTWKLVSSKYILQSRAFSSQHIIDNKFVHHPKYSYINKKWERGENTWYILQKSLFSIPQIPSPPIQDNKYNGWVIIISQTKNFSTSN